MRTLVTYSSKHGSTGEVAEAIFNTLQDRGLEASVCPVSNVKNLQAYDVVVIGSALYNNQWMPQAIQLLRQRVDILAQKLVWLFSVGPTGEGVAAEMFGGFRFPEDIQAVVDTITPQDITVFHGKLDLSVLSLAELQIVKRYGGDMGDFRRWDEIEAWAHSIAGTLLERKRDYSAKA